MAKATLIPHQDAEDVYFETDVQQNTQNKTDAEIKTDALTDALREDVEAFVSIALETGGHSEFVCRLPADEYDFPGLQDFLQKRYGAGKYRCRVYAKGRMTANKLIVIAAPRADASSTQAPPSVGGEVSNVLAQVLGTIQHQQEQLINTLRSQQSGKKELLEDMLMLRQLMGEPAPQANPMAQLRDTFETLKALGVPIGGAAPEQEEGFGAILEKLTPLVTHAIQGSATARANPQYQPNPTQPPKGDGMNLGMIKSGLTQLLRGASKGADPGIYAELICDQLPIDTIKKFILAPGSADKLVALDRRVAEYASWFDELAEHLKAKLGLDSKYSDMYTDDEAEIIEGDNTSGATSVSNDTERACGNPGHPEGDGENS